MILILLFIIPLSSAYGGGTTEDLEAIKTNYNENFNAPSFVRTLFGDQRINLYISHEDGDQSIVGAISENSKVNELQEGAIENPTLNVYLNEETMESILSSQMPFDALSTALDDGSLRYESVTVGNKVKLGFARTVIKIVSWFR